MAQNLTIDPASAAPGTRRSVVGTGFSPASGVKLPVTGVTFVASLYPAPDGSFKAGLPPLPATVGKYPVKAVVGGVTVASADATVAVPLSFSSTIKEGDVITAPTPWVATFTAGKPTSVDFLIDGVLVWPEKLEPWGGTLDPANVPGIGLLSNGAHVFVVAGHDGSGSVVTTVTATVSIPAPPPPPGGGGGGGGGTPPGGGGGGGGPDPGPGTGLTGTWFGSIEADTKANIAVGRDAQAVAHIFTASQTGFVRSVRWEQRWGPGHGAPGQGYSYGNGGVMHISLQTVDGSGNPTGTILAEMTYTPGNPPGDVNTHLDSFFNSVGAVTSGTRYAIVWENVASGASVNFMSVNNVYVYNGPHSPRQPGYTDTGYMVRTKSGGTWSLEGSYTAVMDVTLVNGGGAVIGHDGMGYIQNMTDIAFVGIIEGSSNLVRQTLTPTANKTVLDVWLRVRRDHGTGSLTITLKTLAGVTIEAVTIPYTEVPASAAGNDNGGQVWVHRTFASSHLLTAGTAYAIEATCPAGTRYTAQAVRSGGDVGYLSPTFVEGSGQRSTNGGGSFADLYLYSPVDLQFGFHL